MNVSFQIPKICKNSTICWDSAKSKIKERTMNDKYLAITPPMGWNSWNTFSWEINEELIKTAADAFITEGLKDAGY